MRAIVLAGIVTTIVLLGTGVSAASVVSCRATADFNIHVSSARNMTCAAAAKDIRRNHQPIAFRFVTPGDFACQRVAGSRLAGQWRCVRGSKAYRFEFSD